LPGIAGPVVNILKNNGIDSKINAKKQKFVFANNLKDEDYESLSDALIYAPIPYDVAWKEGATDIIVLRSKPDGTDVIGNGGSFGEKLVWKRFLTRKNKLPKIYRLLRRQLHKRLYAKNVLELNEAAIMFEDGDSSSHRKSSSLPPTLTVAIPPGIEEIGRLETRREAIFDGVRDGFARAYDALVEDPNERGRGYEIAQVYFPDEILDYSPEDIQDQQRRDVSVKNNTHISAFETYLTQSGVWPKAWEGTRIFSPYQEAAGEKKVTAVTEEN